MDTNLGAAVFSVVDDTQELSSRSSRYYLRLNAKREWRRCGGVRALHKPSDPALRSGQRQQWRTTCESRKCAYDRAQPLRQWLTDVQQAILCRNY
ncbi:hypothetical protein J6590_017607 [Homalodisca vitripennis]|nr:hypothetical protein J6590_017607 [Homalodisca vitripennis]